MVLKKYNLDELHTFKSLRNYLPVKKHINNILYFAVASPCEIKPMSYLPFDLTCNIPPRLPPPRGANEMGTFRRSFYFSTII